MPAQVTSYKCPACTAPLRFDAGSQLLECDYCGGKYTVEEMERIAHDAEAKAAEAFAQGGGEAYGDWNGENMRAYNCPNCGAQLICEAETAASSCPYCGNPAIVPGQFDGTLRPDYIIPFKLSREDALAALRQHYKKKLLLPRAFSSENHIQELQGIYVPFWLYGGKADANASYAATTTYVYETGDYTVTETRHFDVFRSGSLSFDKVPADGSKKMPNDYMDSIEPFDYADLKPFSTAYMPGFLANKYDETAEDCFSRADSRIKRTALDELYGTVNGYQTVSVRSEDADFRQDKPQYALLPVWMLNTRWKGQDYLFAMNGQTGKMVGDLPMDKGRFWALFAAITVGGGLLSTVLGIGQAIASLFL